jgi:uncharacterized protein YfbU (UPF0304 family)
MNTAALARGMIFVVYSDFKLREIIETFGLTVRESSRLFANVLEQECSELLSILIQGMNLHRIICPE